MVVADYTHYVIVRRDLPFGAILANVAHAAGESFYAFGGDLAFAAICPRSSDAEHSSNTGAVGPSQGSEGAIFRANQTKVVVLRAKHQADLGKLWSRLTAADVPLTTILEVDGEYAGQLMAIGLWPTARADVRKLLNGYQLFTEAA